MTDLRLSWTEITRRQYDQEALRDASDLSDGARWLALQAAPDVSSSAASHRHAPA
jgi:hypothetical protein